MQNQQIWKKSLVFFGKNQAQLGFNLVIVFTREAWCRGPLMATLSAGNTSFEILPDLQLSPYSQGLRLKVRGDFCLVVPLKFFFSWDETVSVSDWNSQRWVHIYAVVISYIL